MEENDVKIAPPPAKLISQMRTIRFGKIFSHVSTASFVCMCVAAIGLIALPLASVFLSVLILALTIGAVVFTLGFAIFMPNSPIPWLWNLLGWLWDADRMMHLSSLLAKSIPYFSIIGIALSVMSIVFVACSKEKGHAGRITCMSIFIGLMVIALFLYFVLGGSL